MAASPSMRELAASDVEKIHLTMQIHRPPRESTIAAVFALSL